MFTNKLMSRLGACHLLLLLGAPALAHGAVPGPAKQPVPAAAQTPAPENPLAVPPN